MSSTTIRLSKRVAHWFILVALLLITAAILPPTPQSTSAAGFCQCTQYVYAKKGLTGSYGDAYTWDDSNGVLIRNGYRQVSSPVAGDVVVYDTSRFSPYGHVGVVDTTPAAGATTMKVRGANQTSTGWFTESGCTNVNIVTFNKRTYGETYWRK